MQITVHHRTHSYYALYPYLFSEKQLNLYYKFVEISRILLKLFLFLMKNINFILFILLLYFI